jgi:hypothetical protein
MNRFEEHLAAQLRFIDRSCQAFDAGDEPEAQRIAISIRVICYQSGHSKSLLTHLGETAISMLRRRAHHLDRGAPAISHRWWFCARMKELPSRALRRSAMRRSDSFRSPIGGRRRLSV